MLTRIPPRHHQIAKASRLRLSFRAQTVILMARTVPQNPVKPNDGGQLNTFLRRKEALSLYRAAARERCYVSKNHAQAGINAEVDASMRHQVIAAGLSR